MKLVVGPYNENGVRQIEAGRRTFLEEYARSREDLKREAVKRTFSAGSHPLENPQGA